MKRKVYFLAILSILLFACNLSANGTPSPVKTAPAAPATSSVPESPTATIPPTATQPPVATELPTPQTNVSCNGLLLFLDPALASGFSCKTVPEVGNQGGPGMDISPEHTDLTLTGYVLSDRFFVPEIRVYPVQRFIELLPDVIPQDVTTLKALIGGGPTGDKGLPLLPIFNAGQEFFAQYRAIPFRNGTGIRFLTQYAQYFDPINNYELFYTFQGLTKDGNYWISAILPISNSILPADGKNPPNGQSWDDFGNNFSTYIADLKTKLDAQPAKSFSPSIAMLDALIRSIRIQP